MCERSKAFAYLECSANTREGVKHVFETAVIAALHTKKEQHKKMLYTVKCLNLRCLNREKTVALQL